MILTEANAVLQAQVDALTAQLAAAEQRATEAERGCADLVNELHRVRGALIDAPEPPEALCAKVFGIVGAALSEKHPGSGWLSPEQGAEKDARIEELTKELAIERLKIATTPTPLVPIGLGIYAIRAPPRAVTIGFTTCAHCPHPGRCVGERICTCKTACQHRALAAHPTEEAANE